MTAETSDHDSAPVSGDEVDASVTHLSYEDARDELVQVVSRLESGGTTLEESLALWERGEALAARCQQWLDHARARLNAATAASATPGQEDQA